MLKISKIILLLSLIFLINKDLFGKSSSKIQKPLFDIQIQKNDRKFARHFHDFYKSFRKKRVDHKAAKKALKLAKKSNLFEDYKSILKNSYTLIRSKPGSFNFYYQCENLNKKQSHKIKIKLSKKIQAYCIDRFLKTISSKRAKKLSLTEKNFIVNNLDRLLNAKNKYRFTKVLGQLKDDSLNFSHLSEKIQRYYISHHVKIEENVLSLLNTNSLLSNHVQETGVYSFSYRNLFKRQFYQYVNNFNRLYRTHQIDRAFTQISHAFNFYENNKDYISAEKAWINVTLAGKRLVSSNHKVLAFELLNKAYGIAPEDEKEEAVFNIFWAHMVFEDYTKSLSIIDNYKLFKKYDSLSPKMKYWISFAVNKTGDKNLFKHLLTKLIDHHPDDFYSIMASKDLVQTFPDITSVSLVSKYRLPASDAINIKGELSEASKNIIQKIKVWLSLGLDSFVQAEVATLKRLDKAELFEDRTLVHTLTKSEYLKLVNYNLIHLFNYNNKFLYSFRILHSSLSKKIFKMNKETLEYLFPPRYFSKIKKYAERQNIDPVLVLSLIRQESAFNTYAVSHAGARGLMQLMPKTARQIQKKVKRSKLHHTDTNLNIGTKYLKGLLKNYKGNLIHSLAAYNAGPGNVKKWKKELFVKDDPLFMIEAIPFSETRNYVKYIYRNLYFYNLILHDKHLHQPIDVSFNVKI